MTIALRCSPRGDEMIEQERRTSEIGTNAKCRLHRIMSEFGMQSGKHLLAMSISHFDPQQTCTTPGSELFFVFLPSNQSPLSQHREIVSFRPTLVRCDATDDAFIQGLNDAGYTEWRQKKRPRCRIHQDRVNLLPRSSTLIHQARSSPSIRRRPRDQPHTWTGRIRQPNRVCTRRCTT